MRVRIAGAPGEGRFNATWPLATLLVGATRIVVHSPVGDWDFPRHTSALEITGQSGLLAAGVTLRCGSLAVRVYFASRSDVDKMIGALRELGWFSGHESNQGPAAG